MLVRGRPLLLLRDSHLMGLPPDFVNHTTTATRKDKGVDCVTSRVCDNNTGWQTSCFVELSCLPVLTHAHLHEIRGCLRAMKLCPPCHPWHTPD